jgi:hypothetical protein
VSPLLLILVRLAFLAGGIPTGDATGLLSLALWLALAMATFMITIYAETTVGAVAGLIAFISTVALGYWLLDTLGGILLGVSVGLFVGTLIGAVLGRSIPDIGFVLSLSGSVFATIGGLLILALESFTGLGSYSLAFGVIGAGLGGFVGAAQILGPRLVAAGSPIRIFVYSLFFIGFLALLRPDAALSFVDSLRVEGPRVLVFLAFTVFADSVSYLKTRSLLRLVLNAGTWKVPMLLALDLVLSVVIFLFLPLVLGLIPEFLEGAMFRGRHPWVGILFWSSFATSAVFYVFVLGSLMVRPLSYAPRFAKHLAIEARPVFVLAVALGAAFTAIYVAGIGAYLAAHALRSL